MTCLLHQHGCATVRFQLESAKPLSRHVCLHEHLERLPIEPLRDLQVSLRSILGLLNSFLRARPSIIAQIDKPSPSRPIVVFSLLASARQSRSHSSIRRFTSIRNRALHFAAPQICCRNSVAIKSIAHRK